jgi:tetratricopeptide (TPR) repeat protein
MHNRICAALVVVAALLATAPIARAADEKDKAEARDRYRRGSKAFDLQRYDEAAAEYSKVYELIDDPGLLFNIGQAQRLGGHHQKAIGSYRSYLHRVPESPMREQVLGWIEESKRALEEQRKQAALKEQQERERQEREQRIREAQNNPPPSGIVTPPPPRKPDLHELALGKKLRLAGIGVGAVGVASLIVGGVFAGLTANINHQLNNPAKSNPPPLYDKSLESRGRTDQAVETAFFAVGGAAIVAGATTLIVGTQKVKRNTFELTPAVGPGRVGASFSVGF